MSQSDLNTRLQEAITLAQAGQRTEARAILEEVVAVNPQLELAWLWLATVSTNRDERIVFLERALALNPYNPTTREAYTRLTGQPYQPPSAPADVDEVQQPAPARQLPLTPGNIILIVAVALTSIVIIWVPISIRNRQRSDDGNGSEEATAIPTIYYAPDTATTAPIIPTDTPEPTRPFPTNTIGPSPTKLTYPPTWTPSVTWTPVPTKRPPATWTPIPTWTSSPTITDTMPPLPPSETPTPSNTPRPATMTAEAIQTRNAGDSASPTP